MAETPSVKQDLLDIADDIRRYQPIVCLNDRGTTVRWTNVTNFQPGIGAEIDMTRPVTDPCTTITRAEYYVFEDRGESILVIKGSDEPDKYDEDPFALWFRDMYQQYDRTRIMPLSGLAKVMQLHGPKLAHPAIVPVQFRPATADHQNVANLMI